MNNYSQLIMDIGNSNIVLAFFNGENETPLIKRTLTDPTQSADVYESIFADFFNSEHINADGIKTVFISSVVPNLTDEIAKAVKTLVSVAPTVFTKAHYKKLPVTIPESATDEIGSDLLANAVMAYNTYKRACIVVDFGTALTFTAVDGHGHIKGVAIAPGLKTACRALFSNTAQLPNVLLTEPDTALGTTTIGAMQSGIILGYKSLVAGLVQRMQNEMGEGCLCLATGGLSGIFKDGETMFDKIDVDFTVKGLKLIAGYLK